MTNEPLIPISPAMMSRLRELSAEADANFRQALAHVAAGDVRDPRLFKALREAKEQMQTLEDMMMSLRPKK